MSRYSNLKFEMPQGTLGRQELEGHENYPSPMTTLRSANIEREQLLAFLEPDLHLYQIVIAPRNI